MGINFLHGDAGWAYSGFNRFRERLAEGLGFRLRSMQGFGGEDLWLSLQPHPLHALLNHSDCDGDISPEDCRRVAPALRAAVAAWEPTDYDRIQAEALADGMDEAAKAGVPLEFC